MNKYMTMELIKLETAKLYILHTVTAIWRQRQRSSLALQMVTIDAYHETLDLQSSHMICISLDKPCI